MADLALLASVLWLPFWLTLILVLAGLFYFKNFYEAPAAGLLMDLLYGLPETRWGGWPLVSFTIGIIIFIGAELLKRRLKFYDNP